MSLMVSEKNEFRWWTLGGLGEVGMNCMVFNFGGTVIPVDAGILFADPNDFGIEAVFPDYSQLIRDHAPKHWIITHAHEDHIGAVPSLFQRYADLGVEPPTIYAPPFAAALIRERLKDGEKIRGGARFIEKVVNVDPDSTLEIGDVVVHLINTRHSTPDSMSLGFHWRRGKGALRAIHTSDFKLDTHAMEDGVRTVDVFDVFQGQQPDFLFIDSTNAERNGQSISETEILAPLERLIRASRNRVYASLFSSNVYRMTALVKIATQAGRRVSIAGRSLQTAYRVAQEIGLADRKACADVAGIELLETSEICKRAKSEQFVICSGSQGENRSALMRMAHGTHSELIIEKDDTVVFSSKTIPGNEKAVSRLINGLLRQGARVLWGDVAFVEAGGPVHASGHARRDEIATVMRRLKPHHVVPCHGELRQLRSCADVAYHVGAEWGLDPSRVHVVENGAQLVFRSDLHSSVEGEDRWELSEQVAQEPGGRMLRFDGFLSPSRDPFIRARKQAATAGMLFASLNRQGAVRVSIQGYYPVNASDAVPKSDEIETHVAKWLEMQLPDLLREKVFDRQDRAFEQNFSDELSRNVRRAFGLKPFTVVHLIQGNL